MNDDKYDILPAENTDRKFRVTENGKLEKREDADTDFEEDLSFDD